MRALKVLVVVMGIMLVVGFAALVAVIAGRVSRSGSAPNTSRAFTRAAVDIPREARIETMAAGPDRIVLELTLSDGRRQLVIIDMATGAHLGTIELRPAQ